DRPDRAAGVGSRTLKRGEVVRADQRRGGLTHRGEVERFGKLPHERARERIADAAGAYLVAIGLRPRAEARVEISRRIGDVEHANVLREPRVERTDHGLDRMREAHTGAGDLPKRVDAGIGASGAVRGDRT